MSKMLETEKLNQSNGSSSSSSTPSPFTAPVLASTSSSTLTKQPSLEASQTVQIVIKEDFQKYLILIQIKRFL